MMRSRRNVVVEHQKDDDHLLNNKKDRRQDDRRNRRERIRRSFFGGSSNSNRSGSNNNDNNKQSNKNDNRDNRRQEVNTTRQPPQQPQQHRHRRDEKQVIEPKHRVLKLPKYDHDEDEDSSIGSSSIYTSGTKGTPFPSSWNNNKFREISDKRIFLGAEIIREDLGITPPRHQHQHATNATSPSSSTLKSAAIERRMNRRHKNNNSNDDNNKNAEDLTSSIVGIQKGGRSSSVGLKQPAVTARKITSGKNNSKNDVIINKSFSAEDTEFSEPCWGVAVPGSSNNRHVNNNDGCNNTIETKSNTTDDDADSSFPSSSTTTSDNYFEDLLPPPPPPDYSPPPLDNDDNHNNHNTGNDEVIGIQRRVIQQTSTSRRDPPPRVVSPTPSSNIEDTTAELQSILTRESTLFPSSIDASTIDDAADDDEETETDDDVLLNNSTLFGSSLEEDEQQGERQQQQPQQDSPRSVQNEGYVPKKYQHQHHHQQQHLQSSLSYSSSSSSSTYSSSLIAVENKLSSKPIMYQSKEEQPLPLSPRLTQILKSSNAVAASASMSSYDELIRSDQGFNHARNAGILWQSIVSQHVRFPSKWFNGKRSPPMGIDCDDTNGNEGDEQEYVDSNDNMDCNKKLNTSYAVSSYSSKGSSSKSSKNSNSHTSVSTNASSNIGGNRQHRWKYISKIRIRSNKILNRIVRNRSSPGRILLHIIVRDILTWRATQDIVIGCYHPNARGIRSTDASNPKNENCRELWMSVRKRIVASSCKQQKMSSPNDNNDNEYVSIVTPSTIHSKKQHRHNSDNPYGIYDDDDECHDDDDSSTVSLINPLLTKGHRIEDVATESPLGSRLKVNNTNMRAVFGDKPPMETLYILESELHERILSAHKQNPVVDLNNSTSTSSTMKNNEPALLLLQEFVLSRMVRPHHHYN